MAEYLLSVGADIESVNDAGRTPFLEAIYWGNERLMNILIVKGCNIYAKDKAASSTDKAIRADKKEEPFPQHEAEKTNLREDLKSPLPPPILHLEKRTQDASEQRIGELKRRLDKAEEERNVTCAEKESLADDLRSSQELIQELQRRLEEERASSQRKERNHTENLHSCQQVSYLD
ncbi:myosin-3-like [Oscarella lobularis]|uniref:myosin-3-like n=1 Tax=Oscarella lobularis TaxID=121494 RepID=UPI00331385AB